MKSSPPVPAHHPCPQHHKIKTKAIWPDSPPMSPTLQDQNKSHMTQFGILAMWSLRWWEEWLGVMWFIVTVSLLLVITSSKYILYWIQIWVFTWVLILDWITCDENQFTMHQSGGSTSTWCALFKILENSFFLF